MDPRSGTHGCCSSTITAVSSSDGSGNFCPPSHTRKESEGTSTTASGANSSFLFLVLLFAVAIGEAEFPEPLYHRERKPIVIKVVDHVQWISVKAAQQENE